MLQNAKTLMIYLHSRMPGRQWKGDYQLEFTFWPLGASHFIGGYHIWTICIDSCHIFQWTESMYPRRTYSIWMHITSPPNPNEHKGDNLDSPDGGRSLDMDWMGIQFPSHPRHRPGPEFLESFVTPYEYHPVQLSFGCSGPLSADTQVFQPGACPSIRTLFFSGKC